MAATDESNKFFGFWNNDDDEQPAAADVRMSSQDFQRQQDFARQMRFSRSKFRRINSLDLIPEDPGQENATADETAELAQVRTELSGQHQLRRDAGRRNSPAANRSVLRRILYFWPNMLMKLLLLILRYIVFIPLSIAAPSFWLSALLWIFWKLVRIPISCIKALLHSDAHSVSSSISMAAHKRTVLISGGSTIQTLHLARNFYLSGARVVVFEFEGLFGLARFSTAVDKFYVVPRPTAQNSQSVDSYITALCHIAMKEKPSCYVPVCATSPAYYDALAKPSLELLGCASFIPGLQDCLQLDDCLRFYQKCEAQQIALPPYSVLSSMTDLLNLYSSGFISNFRNILMAVGQQGLLERYKYVLPNQRRDFKFNHEISEQQQWMVVRDLPGEHFVTCTTVKESRVVANVSCKVDMGTKNLVPVVGGRQDADADATESDDALINSWLHAFFARCRFQRLINGHISFRLVKSQGRLLPLGVRLGLGLPYICYNRSHAQVLCRTIKCVHKRQRSLASADDESALLSAITAWSSIERSSATAALDKREALFAYWDPLPYCAYYHFQLPLESVKLFLQRRHRSSAKTLSPRITMPVH